MGREGSYEPLQESRFGGDSVHGNADCEETPQGSGVIIHVVESGRSRWNHIEDLDSFFTRMYWYHQKHGFGCMMLQEVCELGQFVFVVSFSSFLFNCVDYPILFRDRVTNNTANHKVTIADAVLPPGQCLASFGLVTWLCVLIAGIFWLLRVIKVIYHFFQFWDIKLFYNTALKIEDSELDNLTWHEVQERVRAVQSEQQMCIHKKDLSELDIYHRILRFKNYMVAMVNKSLFPVRFKLPCIGNVVFFTRGFKYNLEMILFWGPWSPFENSWHLKEDYKKNVKRQELAALLSKHILWIAIANFMFCPLILLWQILYFFFNYAEVIKREPGSLGSRSWSLYGRLYFRHFNELDHELNARLNRAYRPSSKYMNSFSSSPVLTILAKNVAFIAGGILAVLLILTIYDEDILQVEHVLTTMTVLGGAVAVSRSFIPDENLVWCPQKLLKLVLAEVHYFPDSWEVATNQHNVRDEFSQLFQYRAVALIEEVLSPILTPFILIFYVRGKALDIVDFYRNFTVSVVGVGDVCSFAQMDVKKHGNPDWQNIDSGGPFAETDSSARPEPPQVNQYTQAEDGKTELSLIHFTLTNPTWKMPNEAKTFVQALKRNAQRELEQTRGGALETSLHTVSSLGEGYNSLIRSIINNRPVLVSSDQYVNTSETAGDSNNEFTVPDSSRIGGMRRENSSGLNYSSIRGGLSRVEGPLYSDTGILHSLHHSASQTNVASLLSPRSVITPLQEDVVPSEFVAADMSLSTLYLHELHHRQVRRRGYQREQSQRSLWQRPHQQPSASVSPSRPESHLIMGGGMQPGVASGSSRLAESTPLLKHLEKR